MALACDILIATEHARLGLPEPGVGVVAATTGGVHRLAKRMPLSIARGYILTGKDMAAQEAYRWGIVNEEVPLPDLMPTVHRWTNEILECSPLAVRASKQCAVMGVGVTLDEALAQRYPALK
jgi:enoyl-CoA hydratase/carnithine racemase